MSPIRRLSAAALVGTLGLGLVGLVSPAANADTTWGELVGGQHGLGDTTWGEKVRVHQLRDTTWGEKTRVHQLRDTTWGEKTTIRR